MQEWIKCYQSIKIKDWLTKQQNELIDIDCYFAQNWQFSYLWPFILVPKTVPNRQKDQI